LFATRIVKKTKQKTLDYIGFKNMCVCAGFEDNINFFDHMIDCYYASFTEVDKKPCKKPISQEDLIQFFKKISKILFPSEDDE
jgi:hypothetical protein